MKDSITPPSKGSEGLTKEIMREWAECERRRALLASKNSDLDKFDSNWEFKVE